MKKKLILPEYKTTNIMQSQTQSRSQDIHNKHNSIRQPHTKHYDIEQNIKKTDPKSKKKAHLDDFLKSYQPKNVKESIQPYIKTTKLKDYEFLENHNRNKLIVGKTTVRYIPIKNSFINKNYEQHIRSGGLLLGGGTFCNGSFSEMNENDLGKWTHIMIRITIPDSKTNENKLLFLSLKNNYIFLKKLSRRANVNRSNDNTKQLFAEILDSLNKL